MRGDFMKKISLICLGILGMTVCLWGNDTSGQLLPTGEIKFERQPAILLRHEALVLSEKVAVDYLFENTSAADVTTQVFFPLPSVSPLRIYFHQDHNFHFKLFVNGQEMPYQTHRRISVNGKDITRYFDMMGLDAYDKSIEIDGADLDGTNARLRAVVSHLPQNVLEEMKQLGIAEKSCLKMDEYQDKCVEFSDQYQLSNLDYKQEVSFYWMQTFPAGTTTHIYHEYVPSFVENSVGAPYAQDIPFTYNEKGNDSFWKAASYIVTTANNWQRPIEKFNLLVMGEKGAAVSAYQDYNVSQTRVSSGPYLMEEKRDFVPTQEILFEIARDPKQPQTAVVLPRLYEVRGTNTYVWAIAAPKEGWMTVLDEKGASYSTQSSNLIDFWK